jgi:gag-polypeptide of LTR copia-type
MKLKGMHLSKSLASQMALEKWLYRLMMEEDMDSSVHLGAFNTLVRDMYNTGKKIEEEDQTYLFMIFLPKILLRYLC